MLTYIITACMTTVIMMAGSSLGEDQKPQMEIDLEGTTSIVPPLTQSLNLTCSLVTATDSDPEDKKADFKTITGVYIILKKLGSREEADVAKITISNPNNAILSDLLPHATIIGFGLSDGFIKVGVSAPDDNHAGDYTCKVMGFNTDDEPVTLTHTVPVQYSAPDVANLAQYVHDKDLSQDTEILKHEMEITDLKTKVSTQVAFSAVMDNGQSSASEVVSSNTDLVFNKTLVNIGEGYNTSTGVFTCPVAGNYYIRYDLQVDHKNGKADSAVYLVHNGNRVAWSWMYDSDAASNAHGVIGAGLVLQLEQGDELKVRTWHRQSRLFWKYYAYGCMFTGYLLK